jgi:hypothetical protein
VIFPWLACHTTRPLSSSSACGEAWRTPVRLAAARDSDFWATTSMKPVARSGVSSWKAAYSRYALRLVPQR